MVLDPLLQTKIVVTVLVVLFLSAIAENVSPRLVGVLYGTLLGIAAATTVLALRILHPARIAGVGA